MPSPTQVFTTLFEAALGGDEAAQKRLFSVLYSELHRLAHAAMRKERPGHLLQTTALVHEAYMRLVEDEGQRWENRAHFYKVAAGAMRRILVDEARRAKAVKRGGGAVAITLETRMGAKGTSTDAEGFLDIEALEQALQKLAADERHERKCTVVELHFFAGLPFEQVGEILEISTVTAKRDWRFARAWLRREIDPEAGDGDAG